MTAVSWVAALVACFAYGVGSVLQSVGAQRTTRAAGVSGIALVLVQLPYLVGLGADGLGFLANVLALQRLPLFLVQSILTGSVGVTAVLASLRGDRLRVRDWISLGVLALGLVLLCVTATAQHAAQVSVRAQWIILISVLLPVAVGLVAIRLPNRTASRLLAVAAGLAWTGVAVASRGLSGQRISWALLAEPLLWTVALQGVIGTVAFALALQRGPVTPVTAITFVLEMIVPSVVGLWLFGDTVGHGLVGWALLGFTLAVGGTVSLLRFAT